MIEIGDLIWTNTSVDRQYVQIPVIFIFEHAGIRNYVVELRHDPAPPILGIRDDGNCWLENPNDIDR